MIDFLTSLSDWQVLLLALVTVAVVSIAVALLIRRFLGPGPRDRAGITAAAYMTALGSLFAILTGFLISSEYLTLREANLTNVEYWEGFQSRGAPRTYSFSVGARF